MFSRRSARLWSSGVGKRNAAFDSEQARTQSGGQVDTNWTLVVADPSIPPSRASLPTTSSEASRWFTAVHLRTCFSFSAGPLSVVAIGSLTVVKFASKQATFGTPPLLLITISCRNCFSDCVVKPHRFITMMHKSSSLSLHRRPLEQSCLGALFAHAWVKTIRL